jgi:hypothetical protein
MAKEQEIKESMEIGAICQKCAVIEKESSSVTHVAETADAPRTRTGTRGGVMPPRLVAGPAAAVLPHAMG